MPSKIEVDKIIREILKITLNVTEGQNGTPRLDNATNQILHAIYQAIEGVRPKDKIFWKGMSKGLRNFHEGINRGYSVYDKALAKMFGRENTIGGKFIASSTGISNTTKYNPTPTKGEGKNAKQD